MRARAVAHDAAGIGIVAPLLRDDLGAHQPRIEHPAHRRDGDVHVQQPGPQRGNDGDDQHQERDGDQQVHEPAEQRIGQAAGVADQRAHEGAEHRREQGAEDGDLQVDARRPDRARQDVAAEIVGAERMRRNSAVAAARRSRRHRADRARSGPVPAAQASNTSRMAAPAISPDPAAGVAPRARGQLRPPRLADRLRHVAIRGSSSACNASTARNTTETSTHSTMVSPCTTA